MEEESTALPKIQHVAPGRLVSASTGGGGGGGSGGGGGGGGGGEGSKRKREKVVSARVEEENFAKLRQAEEQLLAAREDGEQAAAKVREMSQDLQDIKEVGGANSRPGRSDHSGSGHVSCVPMLGCVCVCVCVCRRTLICSRGWPCWRQSMTICSSSTASYRTRVRQCVCVCMRVCVSV